MSELICEILNINKIAEKKILDAKKDEEEIKKNIVKRKKEIMEKVKNEADKKLHILSKYELENFNNELSNLENYKIEKFQKLKKLFELNHDSLVNDIVCKTLN